MKDFRVVRGGGVGGRKMVRAEIESTDSQRQAEPAVGPMAASGCLKPTNPSLLVISHFSVTRGSFFVTRMWRFMP